MNMKGVLVMKTLINTGLWEFQLRITQRVQLINLIWNRMKLVNNFIGEMGLGIQNS